MPKAAPLASVYTVRKDNSISYKSNLYSLPLGSYKGRGTAVSVYTEADILIIFDQNGTELCRHKTVTGKGLKVFNTDHKRDKSSAINEMIDQLAILLPDPVQGKNWLNLIKTDKPRYIRDQLIIIRDTIQSTETVLLQKAMDYCVENKITSAIDFKAIIAHYLQTERQNEAEGARIVSLNPLNGKLIEDAFKEPEKSSINDYQSIFNNN